MDRRAFVKNSALSGAGLAINGSGLFKGMGALLLNEQQPVSLNGNRFVTFCIMIRTTPWEVSRDVKLHPRDEAAWHTLQGVKWMREAFAKNNPDGRLTWGFTLNALEDKRKNYLEIRAYAAECQRTYGDEVSYFPGYFPAMYLPRERINREMTEAIETISDFVGNGYRPQAIMGGFLSANNLQYLAEKEKIHAAHAVIWSQSNIDGGGADGSPSYPFYPSTEHFCKPAQNNKDFIDCVNLDGWTMDFICARRNGASDHEITGYNSRRGVGPIETYIGWGLDLGHREVMHTQSIHFDKGYELNGFGWVTNIWEAQLVYEFGKDLVCNALEMWVTGTKKRWPDTRFVTFGEYGNIWRNQHKNNDHWNYRFEERGSGLGDSYNNLEIKWFMNKEFRLALLRDWHQNTPEMVIDFTRYDLAAKEPADPSPQHPDKNWSLINEINQKGLRPRDKPKLIRELSAKDRDMIAGYYPKLMD
ncbi:DUF3863 domain-containing protein [Mucilaginibacter xinganensis]|uniref:DUF3863 domain-containing protein n=1 Tax=Mucilaginibacter xinganensis TaxID=1234841 RepID=A0A223NZM9_9SPHI|nr:DUF3863 domain-containing protein [Mucilaginibacter xinganensis]ASU35031.1 hypothetical protein MuYL_3146 [Mucilaginibacter xinganensis]